MRCPPPGIEPKRKMHWLKPYLGNSRLKLSNYWHCVFVRWYYLMTIYHCQWDTELCIFLKNSLVIWKQLCCQGQKNFSSDKQYKKTHTEIFGKWCERVRLISRLWWHHGFGYLQACLTLAWWLLPAPRLPDVLCGKPREGRVLGLQPFLLGPARGFLLITQISNRCAEAKHLIFIPKCFFFKWQMFFKAKKEKYYYTVFSCNTQQHGIHVFKSQLILLFEQGAKPMVSEWKALCNCLRALVRFI